VSGVAFYSSTATECSRGTVPVNDLVCPSHLQVIPKMGQSVDRGWTGGNIHEAANDFYLNAYIDVDMFCISSRIY